MAIVNGNLVKGYGTAGDQVDDAGSIVLTVGDPGSDTSFPTEQAMREALNTKQALDATLTALAGLATGASKVPYFTAADVAALLDLVTTVGDPGSDTAVPSEKGVREALNTKQALDATLTALAGLTTGANKAIKFTAADAAETIDVAENTVLGRITSGVLTALTGAQVRALAAVYSQEEVDNLVDGLAHKKMAIDYIVNNTAAPPTEVTGDRYILSHDGGAPHANWDGAAAGDIVEFNGVTWDATTPQEGWTLLADVVNREYTFSDTVWVKRAGLEAHNDTSGKQGGTTDEYYHLTSARHTVLALLGDLAPAANKFPLFTGAASASLLELTASTILGMKATGGPVALAKADALTILNVEDGADVTDDANVRAALAAATADIAVNSKKITGLAAGVNAGDAVNKTQLDAKANLVGAVDIEITDAAKGVILRTGDAHRARLTLTGTTPTYNVVVTDLGAA